MSQTNGTTATVENSTDLESPAEREPYRPEASTSKVHESIVTSLGNVVTEAFYQAGTFVDLAEDYDRDAALAVRYGHLVDATECVEIAMTYLGLMKSTLGYRMRVEDDNGGPCPF